MEAALLSSSIGHQYQKNLHTWQHLLINLEDRKSYIFVSIYCFLANQIFLVKKGKKKTYAEKDGSSCRK